MAAGVLAAGDNPVLLSDADYTKPEHDAAVFYGYEKNGPAIMAGYKAAGRKVVYVDLGYWGRRNGGRWVGFHKVAVNSRHPTAYFQAIPKDDSRVSIFGIRPLPWRSGRKIIVAGMSGRAARAVGLEPEEWERWAVTELRKHTDRPIVYRPKPSWHDAQPIEGSEFGGGEPLARALGDCHAVVTHHSNTAVDGLVEGVPAFCWYGVAKPMALQDLSRIEGPWRPAGRRQWMANVAWCQWSVDEMRNGHCWRHLKSDGLVP